MLLYKKYTSHTLFSKGLQKGWFWLCVRGLGLGTDKDCHILNPSSSDHSSTSSSFSLAAQPWALRVKALCLELVLTSASYLQLDLQLELQLTRTVCGTWLYNCLSSTCFMCAYASAPNSTTSTGQSDILISWTGCTCFAVLLLICTGASLDWRLGRGSICYSSNIQVYRFFKKITCGLSFFRISCLEGIIYEPELDNDYIEWIFH